MPKTLAGKPSLDGGLDYIVESDDFQLREYRLDKGQSLTTPDELGACIWFVLSGEIRLGNHHHYSRSGSAFYQRPEEVNVIHATSDALIYRASVSARVFLNSIHLCRISNRALAFSDVKTQEVTS